MSKHKYSTLEFGKYQGRCLDSVPLDYLEWIKTEQPRGLRPGQLDEVKRLLASAVEDPILAQARRERSERPAPLELDPEFFPVSVTAAPEVLGLPQLAERINVEHECFGAMMQTCLKHAQSAGNLLLRAKTLVSHGQWLDWLEANVRCSARTAQQYMRVAREWDCLTKCAGPAHLSIERVVLLISDAKGNADRERCATDEELLVRLVRPPRAKAGEPDWTEGLPEADQQRVMQLSRERRADTSKNIVRRMDAEAKEFLERRLQAQEQVLAAEAPDSDTSPELRVVERDGEPNGVEDSADTDDVTAQLHEDERLKTDAEAARPLPPNAKPRAQLAVAAVLATAPVPTMIVPTNLEGIRQLWERLSDTDRQAFLAEVVASL